MPTINVRSIGIVAKREDLLQAENPIIHLAWNESRVLSPTLRWFPPKLAKRDRY